MNFSGQSHDHKVYEPLFAETDRTDRLSGSDITIEQFNVFVNLQRRAENEHLLRQQKKHRNLTTLEVYKIRCQNIEDQKKLLYIL